MSKILKAVLLFTVAAGISEAMGAPPARTRTPGDDPLDKMLEYYRSEDTGPVHFRSYSFKVVRVISDNEGIFKVYCRDEIYSSGKRANTPKDRRIADVCIKGFDLSGRAAGDLLELEYGKTVWRIGAYVSGKRSYPKYTTDRREAEEYAKTHHKKKAIRRFVP